MSWKRWRPKLPKSMRSMSLTKSRSVCPRIIAISLADVVGDGYFVSIHQPGQGCVENPLLQLVNTDWGSGLFADSHDSFAYIPRLTANAQSQKEGVEAVWYLDLPRIPPHSITGK